MPATNATKEQVKDMLDIQQDVIMKFFNNHVDKLEKKIEVLTDENKSLRSEVIDLKLEVNSMKDTVVFLSAKFDELVNKPQQTDNAKDETIQKINAENDLLSAKVTELENRSRRNNLRFDGIPELENENWNQSEECVLEFVEKTQVGYHEYKNRTLPSRRGKERRTTQNNSM